jgi:uncharacterized membrane protein
LVIFETLLSYAIKATEEEGFLMVRMRRRWPARINRRMGKTMIRQVLICIIILLIVIVAKKMDNAIVNNTYQAIKAQFTKEITFASIADSGMAFIGKFKEGTF